MKYDKAKAIIWYPEVYSEAQIQEAAHTILTAHASDHEDTQRAKAMSDYEEVEGDGCTIYRKKEGR